MIRQICANSRHTTMMYDIKNSKTLATRINLHPGNKNFTNLSKLEQSNLPLRTLRTLPRDYTLKMNSLKKNDICELNEQTDKDVNVIIDTFNQKLNYGTPRQWVSKCDCIKYETQLELQFNTRAKYTHINKRYIPSVIAKNQTILTQHRKKPRQQYNKFRGQRGDTEYLPPPPLPTFEPKKQAKVDARKKQFAHVEVKFDNWWSDGSMFVAADSNWLDDPHTTKEKVELTKFDFLHDRYAHKDEFDFWGVAQSDDKIATIESEMRPYHDQVTNLVTGEIVKLDIRDDKLPEIKAKDSPRLMKKLKNTIEPILLPVIPKPTFTSDALTFKHYAVAKSLDAMADKKQYRVKAYVWDDQEFLDGLPSEWRGMVMRVGEYFRDTELVYKLVDAFYELNASKSNPGFATEVLYLIGGTYLSRDLELLQYFVSHGANINRSLLRSFGAVAQSGRAQGLVSTIRKLRKPRAKTPTARSVSPVVYYDVPNKHLTFDCTVESKTPKPSWKTAYRSIRNLPATVEAVNRLDFDTIQHDLEDMHKLIDKTKNVGTALLSAATITNLVTAFVDFGIDIKYILKNSSVPIYIKIYKVTTMIFRIIKTAVSFPISTAAFTAFLTKISDMHGAVAQSAFKPLSMVLGLAATLVKGKVPENQTMNRLVDIAKDFNSLHSAFSKFEDFLPWIKDKFYHILEYVAAYFEMDKLMVWIDEHTDGKISKFLERATTYLMTDAELVGEDPVNDVILLQLNQEKDEIFKYFVHHGTSKHGIMFKDIVKKLEERKMNYDYAQADIVGRVCPFVICLHGQSQIGKSNAMTNIVDELLWDVPVKKRLWFKPQGEFWDGYTGQLGIGYDEFGARIDEDYAGFLELVSSNKFIPNFASLDNATIGKKGTLVQPRLVIMGTNSKNNTGITNVINNPDAFNNRRHLLVDVFPKLGVEKQLDNSHLEFTICNSSTTQQLDHVYINNVRHDCPLSYADFLKYAKASYDAHYANQMRILNHKKATRKLQAMAQAGMEDCPTYVVGQEWKEDTEIDEKEAGAITLDWKNLRNRIKTMGYIAAGITTACTVVVLGVGLIITRIKSKKTPEEKILKAITEANDIDDELKTKLKNVTINYKPKTPPIPKPRAFPDIFSEAYDFQQRFGRFRKPIVAEATNDMNAQSIVELLSNRMMKFSFVDEGKTVSFGQSNCFPVEGSWIIFPGHVLTESVKEFKGFIHLEQISPSGTQEFYVPFKLENVRKIEDNDWALYNCSKYLPPFKSIVHHFVSEKDNFKRGTMPATLLVMRSYISAHEIDITYLQRPAYYKSATNDYSISSGFSYKANTKYGDCGAPLILFDTQQVRKICGIHVAGYLSSAKAISHLVTQEQLQKLLCVTQSSNIPFDFKHQSDIPNCYFVGNVKPEWEMHQPPTTKLRPSPLQDYIAPEKFPSVLSVDDKRVDSTRDIIKTQVMKYAKPNFAFDEERLTRACDTISTKLNYYDVSFERRLLTEKEVLNGSDFLDRLNPHTSPGFPFVKTTYKEREGKGKTSYMTLEGDEWVITDERITSMYEQREQMAKQGHRIPSVWVVALKDELLKPDKISAGGTRVFMSPPMDFTMLTRKYFGRFCGFIAKHNIDVGIGVGMNPESIQWNELFLKLIGQNWKCLAMDYTWYDGTLVANLMFAFLHIANSWYDDDYAIVREVIVHELVYTPFLIADTIYLKCHGNPSGNPLTAIMNSICGLLLIIMELDLQNPTDVRFWRDAYVCVYGDDNIMSLGSHLKFDPIKFSKRLLEHGMVVTSDTKNDNEYEKLIFDCTFLKRGFRRGDGNLSRFVVPIMNKKSINAMLTWWRDSGDIEMREACETNIEAAFRFLFWDGPDEYNARRHEILTYCAECELQPHILTYAEMMRSFTEHDLDQTIH